jgi:hypothetical protein
VLKEKRVPCGDMEKGYPEFRISLAADFRHHTVEWNDIFRQPMSPGLGPYTAANDVLEIVRRCPLP